MKRFLLFIVAVVSMFTFTSCEDRVTMPFNYAIGIDNTKEMAYGNEMAVKLHIRSCGALVDAKLDAITASGMGEYEAQSSADAQAIAIFNTNADKIDVKELLSMFVDGASFDYTLYRVKYSSTPEDPAVYTPVKSRTFKK